MKKMSPMALLFMLAWFILGSLGLTGLATWFFIQANPELKALSTLVHVLGYVSWVFETAGKLPSPLDKAAIIFFLGVGAAIVIGALLAVAYIKQEIRYFLRG